MSSLSNVDAAFFETQNAAINRDSAKFNSYRFEMRNRINSWNELSGPDRRRLGHEAESHVNKLLLEVQPPPPIPITQLMSRLDIKPIGQS
jgi:hypothetical protein